MNAEDYKAGYRAGFEAGRVKALEEPAAKLDLVALSRASTAPPPRRQRPTSGSRRCTCGHVDTTHNELGYCQARGARYSDGCHCDGFDRVAPAVLDQTTMETNR